MLFIYIWFGALIAIIIMAVTSLVKRKKNNRENEERFRGFEEKLDNLTSRMTKQDVIDCMGEPDSIRKFQVVYVSNYIPRGNDYEKKTYTLEFDSNGYYQRYTLTESSRKTY